MGGRLLTRWLHRPLRAIAPLQARQQALAEVHSNYGYEPLHNLLKRVGDLERILGRLALRSARPRDLSRLHASMATYPELQAALRDAQAPKLPQLAHTISERSEEHTSELQS